MSLQFIGFFGFLLTALGFTGLCFLLAIRRPSLLLGRLFLGTNLVQALWAWTMTLAFTRLSPPPYVFAVIEALRTLAWSIFLVALVQGMFPGSSSTGVNSRKTFALSVPRIGLVASILIALTSVIVDLLGQTDQTTFMLKTLAAVVGLVCLEQSYRATAVDRRWAMKFLMIALVGLFAFDLVMYSEALMFSRLNFQWWTARGYVNALLLPLIVVAAIRNRDWKVQVSVSRNMVFHSTALLIAGAYLVLASLAGYYVRYVGGKWGEVAQAVVVFGAVVSLIMILLSGAMRARLKVFLAKNFFNYRFDYREEWLRLTETLHSSKASESSQAISAETFIKSLGRIVDSTGGALWQRKDDDYPLTGQVGLDQLRVDLNAKMPLIEFLARREWIIDLDEYRANRSAYESIVLPNELLINKALWILLPLMNSGRLEGVLGLNRPLSETVLNWEVRDILKVGARQIASVVSLQSAVESLVQSRQFDSFNKMSAFVVHDLKNLVAQLALLVRNASTHKHDPEFQKDMLDTVENVLERMQNLLLQLRLGTKPIEKPQSVSLTDLLNRAILAKKGLRPAPNLQVSSDLLGAKILAHPDRLERVLGHLIQNACEAMHDLQGQLDIVAEPSGTNRVSILVKDTGPGMSAKFIQTQLFRPFNSTKAHGMGIGTFESREYLKEIGGSLSVSSQEQIGTTFKIELATAPLQKLDIS
jgi:putative PEP-CTERM system histidine kinase